MTAVVNFFKSILFRIKNFVYWGWKLSDSIDFDYYAFEVMMLLKLKKMRNYFKKYGICDWTTTNPEEEKTTMKALNLAIRILERITTRDDLLYCKKLYQKLEEKWGEYNILTGFNQPTRKNILTEEDKAEYVKDFQAYYDLSAKIFERDNRNLYRILEKYGRRWWD